MKDSQDDSYILCGWMAEDDVEKFLEEIKDDDKVFVVVEETMMHTSENRRQSWKIRSYSNHLRCTFRCMVFRLTMRWIQPFS